MWTRGTFTFENNAVLLSEGRADRTFFQKIIEKRALPKFDFPWPVLDHEDCDEGAKKLHGVSQLGAMLKALKGTFDLQPEVKEKIRGILIVADAKDDAGKTFREIQAQVRDVPSFPVPNAERIVAGGAAGWPSLEIMLLPGDGEPGSLESLYVAALREKNKEVGECLDAYLQCDSIKVETWPPEARDKAKFQCLTAALNRDDPSKGAAYILSVKPPLITLDQDCFGGIADAVKAFCDTVGV